MSSSETNESQQRGPGPRGPRPPWLPAHDPALQQKSIEAAHQFYRNDSQLSTEDRRRLASYFWQKTALYPVLGLPVLWGAIQSPNWLKRKGYLAPNRSYRLAQLGLGFVGLIAGIRVGMGVGTFVQIMQLRSTPAAQDAYAQLSAYPPQLGSRYYSMTAKNPEFALKDPETIDWKNNPLFPFCLVMNRQIIDEWKRAQEQSMDRRRGLDQHQNQEVVQRMSGKSPPELTGTSWDNVIAKNRTPSSTPQRDSSQQPPPPPAPPLAVEQPAQRFPVWKAERPQESPQQLGTDSLIDGNLEDSTYTGDLEADQRKFDALLERERQGVGVDDFNAPEKKW